MAEKELVTRDLWPVGLPSLLDDSFFPQLRNLNQSGMSLSEDDKHVQVEAALPGLTAKDITINFANSVLSISGERKIEEKPDKRSYRTLQSSYSYQIALPSNVKDDQEPDAELKNGVLTITFEKEPQASARKIKIKE